MAEIQRIVTGAGEIRQRIHKKITEGVLELFPIQGKRYTAEIKRIWVDSKHLTYKQQTDILLSKGNASDYIMADIELKETETGKVVGELKDHRIMNIPYFTDRWTFIVDGNEYSISNQLRTKSGVYTRKKGNDEIEATFNLEKGANFKILMDPATGIFKVDMLGSTFLLFGLLKVLGGTETDIQRVLGKELYDVNMKALTDAQYRRSVDILYEKVATYKMKENTSLDKEAEVYNYFANKTSLNPDTTKITLGTSVSNVNANAILQAARRILEVYNSTGDIDERDNLEFQKIYSVEDIVKETITKNKAIVLKLKQKLDGFNPKGDDPAKIFSSNVFSRPLRSFLTTSAIARLPLQINPMEMVDSISTVTRLGEGAISSERAAPEDARALHLSYMGVIDPFATPESSKVGLDARFALSALKGDDNEIYKEVINVSTGKLERHRLIDLRLKKVGFPDEPNKPTNASDNVKAVYDGKVVSVKRGELDYLTPNPMYMYTATTSSIPLINAIQGNRTLMGAKHVQQALPLADPDKRLVYSKFPSSFSVTNHTEDFFGKILVPKSPVTGTITKIDDEYIYIKDDNKETHKVEYIKNMPLATKTVLVNTLKYKVGDSVRKGDLLAESNFSKDGEMTLGKNLNIAYMPYYGYNHEDGIVISESASKKLTSVHTDKVSVSLLENMVLEKSKYTAKFPTKYTLEQLNKLDADGVVKKGERVVYGDPLILLLADNADSKVNIVLGNLHKSLKTPFKDISEVYTEPVEGEITEVFKNKRIVTVVVQTNKPAVIGDKLSGSYGNKGVIVKIVPDSDMIQNKAGEAMDAVFTSAGVIGRINPAQIEESVLGKIAKKTGQRYGIENFSIPNYVGFVRDEMKKHGVTDKEIVVDPLTGKEISGITVGTQHVYKLYKTTDSNFAGRGVEGPHDSDETPVGSGESGPKAIGAMEVNALIAHGARSILKESTLIRGQKNNDYWKQFQYGMFPTDPLSKNTFGRFEVILRQGGIKVDREGDDLVAKPLTDKDILVQSSGEIKNPLRLNAKLQPEKNGLFDEVTTGGLEGSKWGHIKLVEPVINPVFEGAAKTVLGLDTKTFNDLYKKEGGKKFRDMLNAVDIDKRISEIKSKLDIAKDSELDKLVKEYKYLNALKATGEKAGDAYTLSVIPVIPPKFRPITFQKNGDLLENDANIFYRDILLQNETLKDLKKTGIKDAVESGRNALQDRVKELTGVIDPKTTFLSSRGYKGALSYIAGDVPKRGYFQRKVIYNQMNLTGRATIAPDVNLGLDEVGLPEDMAWNMYEPFIMREMVSQGISPVEAKTQIKDRSELATTILQSELEKRPVLVNRAPTLWKYSIIAAKPKMVPGKTLLVNTIWEAGTSADFDGDSSLGSIFTRVPKGSILDLDKKTMVPEGSILDLDKKTIDINEKSDILDLKEANMPFRSNTKIRHTYGVTNLLNFPRGELKSSSQNVDVYAVPAGVEVLTVWNGEERWLPVESYSVHRNLTMLEVTTNSSRTIQVSNDHSLVTLDENLDYMRAPATVGMSVPRVRRSIGSYAQVEPVTHIDIVQHPKDKYQFTTNQLKADEGLGYFFGVYIGDGWVNKELRPQDIMLASTTPQIVDKIKEVFNQYSTEPVYMTLVNSPHEFEGFQCFSQKYTWNCLTIANLLRQNIGLGAAYKKLPDFWAHTSDDFRWGLLAGLIDTDGTISTDKRGRTNVAYTTISPDLAYGLVALANTLGLTITCTVDRRKTKAGNIVYNLTFTKESIGRMQGVLPVQHPRKLENLNSATFKTDFDAKRYAPNLSMQRIEELGVAHGKASRYEGKDSVCSTICSLKRTKRPITLFAAKRLFAAMPEFFEQNPFWKKWKDMCLDTNIEWEFIEHIMPLPEVTEAYDLTIPPAYTMVLDSGIVVYDTMTVHVPVSEEAIADAKTMLPSKLVFSDKKKGDLLYAPKTEPVMGLFKATKNLGRPLTGKAKKYKSEEEAWLAYHRGELKATDIVEID